MVFGRGDREKKKEEFLLECHEDYEKLMYEFFFSTTTVSDLEKHHLEVKAQIFEDLPEKWKTFFGSSKISSSVPGKLEKKLEEGFISLKKHFEKTKLRDENKPSVPEATIKGKSFYTDEMDKFLKNEPNATAEELTEQHQKTIEEAVSQTKSLAGSAMTLDLLEELRMELNKLYEHFQALAEMNKKCLNDPAIGIDLGTTMSCVAVYNMGNVEVVENWEHRSSRTTPSFITFFEDDTTTYGSLAKEQAYLHPETTIYDAKRMIGREWTDENLTADRKKWPFEIVNDNNNPKVKTWGRTRFPHEVSARLLSRFRIMAEEHLNLQAGSIRKAVITVPAYFTEPQRRATKEAGECAGLKVLNILSEPTAAAIAYTWKRKNSEGARKALIYDLGGGTFDVAIGIVKPRNVEILVVDGDTHLGGQDFDQILMDYCLQEFRDKEGIDLEAGRNSEEKQTRDLARSALCRLKLQCELAKNSLSTSPKQAINVGYIYKSKHLIVEVTQEKLEELITPLIQKTLDIVDRAFANAEEKGISGKDDIDDIILVGGSTRIPLVEKLLKKYFGGKQLCKHINPDEAVAYGAAVQAAILNDDKNVEEIFVQDVTPFSLGIQVVNGVFSRIVPKNSEIPFSHTKRFTTTQDFQKRIRVKIYQGEEEMCANNQFLGEFVVEGFPLRPKEEEMVDVTMTIDSMGMFQVEAKSCSNSIRSCIKIEADRLGMDVDSISRLKKECKEITGSDWRHEQ